MGDIEKKRAQELVAKIAQEPDDAAVSELAALAADALPAMKKAADSGELSPRSREALFRVVAMMARQDPAPLLSRIDAVGQYEEAVVWALGFADPAIVTRPLIRLLRDPDDGVRQAAATSLVRLHTEEAAAALLPALEDSSFAVRFVAVEALHDDDFFRLPAARERLRRIVNDHEVAFHEPEMQRYAREVLQEMER